VAPIKGVSGASMRDLFRWVGWLEGLSYILLLGVAMPLKYIWGDPSWVSVVGMAHGLLFVAYVGMAFLLYLRDKWSIKKLAYAMLASLLPFGPFVFDSKFLDKKF
jgi:integral membrane protein